MSKIDLVCQWCGKNFKRERGEHNRNTKLGRRVFCSLSCTAKQQNADEPDYLLKNRDNFKTIKGARALDKYSSFRYFYKRIKHSHKHKGRAYNLTLQDLKDLWEKQQGICPYTGWKLILPLSSGGWKTLDAPELKASLDRIDSSKGYIGGNVQFTSVMANWAKNNLEEDKLLKFCKAVADYS